MSGAGGRVPHCTPHLEKTGSQAPNQQHPRAGACLARSQQSHCTKTFQGENEGPQRGRIERGEWRLFRQVSSWQAAASYVYPGQCYKSSLHLSTATAEVAAIRSAHSKILIKSELWLQRQQYKSTEALLGHAHACSTHGAGSACTPLPTSAPSVLPTPPPQLPA